MKHTWAMYLLAFALLSVGASEAAPQVVSPQERMVEWSFESRKGYDDPFNDVDIDVIFSRDNQSWRVPTFWRGGNRWTVRFAPPAPGVYSYRLESTDRHNPDLNGHGGQVAIMAYGGPNALFRHGMVKVSANKRYFEHADGTPFYWLADTWWMGLSDRLPFKGFEQLTADRRDKGFTVVLLTAGLAPFEEHCPEDPGCGNEGGPVWEGDFVRINPRYFDAADRRIEVLLDAGIVPEIEGAYQSVLAQMGVAKMKKHWRYIVARFGAYPVFWNVADEATDPPAAVAERVPERYRWILSPPGAWTEITRYIRAIDPNHHPLTVNEWVQPVDFPLQNESLTDFDQLQPGHFGWPSIGSEVMQLDQRYSRTDVTKPVVVGEVGYENHFAMHYENFQRMAFWIATLNGAGGYTYGAAPTFETNNPDKPLHRTQYTFQTWQEGMALPGSYQLGLAGKLLQRYEWWRMAPHPEWVTPRGTTMLEPHVGRTFDVANFDFLGKQMLNADGSPTDGALRAPEEVLPGNGWQVQRGTFRRPYAAGIPGELRIVYTADYPFPPTVLALEPGVCYQAYYWEPTLGIHFDLGAVEVPTPGAVEFEDHFQNDAAANWSEHGSARAERRNGLLVAAGKTVSILDHIRTRDSVVSVGALSRSSAGVILRYQNPDNYVAAVYSANDRLLYWMTRIQGVDHKLTDSVSTTGLGENVHLTTEVRAGWAAASITDGERTFSTPIVDIAPPAPGGPLEAPSANSLLKAGLIGLWHPEDDEVQDFGDFKVRESPKLSTDAHLERRLYDARGEYRGELSGPGWDEWGRDKAILLNEYRPAGFPTTEDWVLVLESPNSLSDEGILRSDSKR